MPYAEYTLVLTPSPPSPSVLALSGLSVQAHAGGTEASPTITSNPDLIRDGTYFSIVRLYGTPTPTEAQIEAGTDGSGAAAAWVLALDGVPGVPYASIDTYAPQISGLYQDADWINEWVHKSAAGAYSNIERVAFSTPDEVPTVSGLAAVENGSTGGIFNFAIDDPNCSVKWVYAGSVTQPTKPQIAAGQDDAGATAPAGAYGSVSVTSIGTKTANVVAGLSPNTTGYIHAYAVDLAGQTGPIVTSAAFTTPPVLTNLYQFANAGVVTGLTVASGTVASNQPDPFGGNNAIAVTCNSGGAGTVSGVTFNATLYDGVNYVSGYFKKGAWASAAARIRFNRSSFGASGNFSTNLVDATLDSPAAPPNQVVVDLGSGWVKVTQKLDTTGWGDFAGILQFYMGDAANDQTITAAADHTLFIYDIRVDRV